MGIVISSRKWNEWGGIKKEGMENDDVICAYPIKNSYNLLYPYKNQYLIGFFSPLSFNLCISNYKDKHYSADVKVQSFLLRCLESPRHQINRNPITPTT